ncbi:MAG: C39 family peptidase [Defluviitaleaceae bacterium]|nr:C39 family peptidase [Defluviitaleaceae bacterium]MCL2263336.1 C39 family peptidase [Defluviitaleaceae bacterium]
MKQHKIFMLSVFFIFSMIIFPTTITATTRSSGIGLAIYSQEVTTGAWVYANDNFEFFLKAAILGGSISVGQDVSLGTPFTIPSTDVLTHYFPVISDGIVVGTFRVFVDEFQSRENSKVTYTGILSPYLADEINTLLHSSKMRSFDAVTLYYDNGNLMRLVDGVSEVLSPNPMGDLPVGVMLTAGFDDLSTVSPLTSTIHIETSTAEPFIKTATGSAIRFDFSAIEPRGVSSRFLDVRITERQGSRPWCGAYATAMILRFMRGNDTSITALRLMQDAYAGMPLRDLERRSFSWGAMERAYTSRGFGVSMRFWQTLTLREVQTELRRNIPIMISTQNLSDGGDHAFVIRGYTYVPGTHSSYSIWNPWNNFFEVMNTNSVQISSGGRLWEWHSTIVGRR